ncbi:MAG: HAD hydrolase-like protein [Bacteroidia bacterium]|nr:HAD hydrolase-like protein [Bacteroidia bacterium]
MQYDIKPGAKGLIFDLDGTLADTMPYHFQGWRKACKKFGAKIDPAFLRKHTGSPGWIIAMEIIKENKLNGNVTADQIIEEKMKLKCAELMKVDPRYIEVFEDGDLGIEAAREAGMMVTDVRSWYDSSYA